MALFTRGAAYYAMVTAALGNLSLPGKPHNIAE
jgi:hypothetical protein